MLSSLKTVADLAAEENKGEEPVVEAGNEGITTPPATPATAPVLQPQSEDFPIEAFNKKFKTQYKSIEEIDAEFGKAKKVDEYEPKIKDYEAAIKRESDYKKQIEEAKSSLNPLSWFSSPDAYTAEQLRRQFPDKNPSLLQELATRDLGKIPDADILVKKYLLDNPDLPEEDVRRTVLEEYGIDADNPSEVNAVSKTKMRIKANEARKEFAELKGSIKIPEVLTDEQRAALQAEARQKKAEAIKPIAEKFSKYEKFTAKVDDKEFEWKVPEESQKGLRDMFEGYFLDGGNEVNEETLKDITDIREAVILRDNFASIYKAIEGDVTLKVKAEYDAKLHNDNPDNLNTTPPAGNDTEPQGMRSLLDKRKRI